MEPSPFDCSSCMCCQHWSRDCSADGRTSAPTDIGIRFGAQHERPCDVHVPKLFERDDAICDKDMDIVTQTLSRQIAPPSDAESSACLQESASVAVTPGDLNLVRPVDSDEDDHANATLSKFGAVASTKCFKMTSMISVAAIPESQRESQSSGKGIVLNFQLVIFGRAAKDLAMRFCGLQLEDPEPESFAVATEIHDGKWGMLTLQPISDSDEIPAKVITQPLETTFVFIVDLKAGQHELAGPEFDVTRWNSILGDSERRILELRARLRMHNNNFKGRESVMCCVLLAPSHSWEADNTAEGKAAMQWAQKHGLKLLTLSSKVQQEHQLLQRSLKQLVLDDFMLGWRSTELTHKKTASQRWVGCCCRRRPR